MYITQIALLDYADNYQLFLLSTKDNESIPLDKNNPLDVVFEFRPISMQYLLHPLLFV